MVVPGGRDQVTQRKLVRCPQIIAGAENIPVTQNPDQVKDAKLLSSGWCQVRYGWSQTEMEQLHIFAKNFTYQAGGDIAFVSVVAAGESPYLYATMEAYRRRKQDDEP